MAADHQLGWGTAPRNVGGSWSLNGSGVFTSPDAIAVGGTPAVPRPPFVATHAFWITAPDISGYPSSFYVPVLWPVGVPSSINVLSATFGSVTINGVSHTEPCK